MDELPGSRPSYFCAANAMRYGIDWANGVGQGGGGGGGLTKLLACTFNQSVVFQSSKFVKK